MHAYTARFPFAPRVMQLFFFFLSSLPLAGVVERGDVSAARGSREIIVPLEKSSRGRSPPSWSSIAREMKSPRSAEKRGGKTAARTHCGSRLHACFTWKRLRRSYPYGVSVVITLTKSSYVDFCILLVFETENERRAAINIACRSFRSAREEGAWPSSRFRILLCALSLSSSLSLFILLCTRERTWGAE